MQIDNFSGTWVFDCIVSELKSPPTAWVQTIHVENGRVSVREEITRETGSSVTELSGAFDGNFYPVTGPTLVDEIAYTFGGESIEGTGRKQGVVVLREVVPLPEADTLHLALRLFLGGKELTLGNAVFRRV